MTPDELLNLDLTTDAATNAAGVAKKDYRKLTAFRNLMTHSTREKLHECPRKWQFLKMNADADASEIGREDNVHFAFGHAIGAGVATFDATQDINQALMAAFLAWDIDLLAVGKKKVAGRVVDSQKTFGSVVWALRTYGDFRTEETDLDQYEVVENEATLLIDWENGWFDSLHVDTIMRHKATGKYKVKENKTTGLSSIDEAMYANSGQALGYSIAVDMLPGAGQDYNVIYCVYLPEEFRWVAFDFPKSSLSKVEWIQDQLNTHQDLDRAAEQNFFPKRSQSCMSFNRRCEYYEACGFKTSRIFGKDFKDLQVATVEDLKAVEDYRHITTLTEILARQKNKLREWKESGLADPEPPRKFIPINSNVTISDDQMKDL